MSYNIGKINISIGGESHAKGITVIIDGIESGYKIDLDELQKFLKRRAPGQNNQSTARCEKDIPEIISGIKDGYTTGSPICAVIWNKDTKSGDYGEKLTVPRPGHADYPAFVKDGEYFNFAGGGQYSARLTVALCFAGGVAKQILKSNGIEVLSHISSVYGIKDVSFNEKIVDISSFEYPIISDIAKDKIIKAIDDAKNNQDSVGGSVECVITGLYVGLGGFMFEGIDGEIAKAVFSIPAVKGIEFGTGFKVCDMLGSENNDEYIIENGEIVTETNNHGGVLGGMTSGMPLIFNVAFKPTPSIAKKQRSVNLEEKKETELFVHGRHDPCVALRAVPCVEAAAALVILGKILMESDKNGFGKNQRRN